jgi:hypothetical protein
MFMCRRGKFNFTSKVLMAIVAADSLLLLPFSSFAQDLPCQDQDPTSSPCPLDTWVWVLVLATMIYGFLQLYRRKNLKEVPKNR